MMPIMPETPSMEQTLLPFVRQLIADKGLLALDDQQKEQLEQQILDQLEDAVYRALIEALPDEQLVQFNRMLDEEASNEEIEDFLLDVDVPYVEPMRRAMEKFREEFLGIETNMTNNLDTVNNGAAEQTPAGQPLQGVASEWPGRSDVEGLSNIADGGMING